MKNLLDERSWSLSRCVLNSRFFSFFFFSKKSLTERVIAVIDKVVEEQDQTRGQLEKQIEDTANSIHQMSAALGKNAPEMEVFDDMSLKQMPLVIHARLENMRNHTTDDSALWV